MSRFIKTHKLVDAKGNEVAHGTSVTSFRGETGVVTDWHPGKTPESTGRVYVRMGEDKHDASFSSYPSVYDLKVVEREKSNA